MIVYDYESKKLYIPDGIGCGCEGGGGECSPEQLNKAYQSGYTNGAATGYADGYDKGLDDGAEQQKALLVETAITENGEYSREDGYSSISVNVPSSGHTDEELQQAFISGITYQKSLLDNLSVTQNGEYLSENGYNYVVVDVPQSGYTQEDLDVAYNSGWTNGYTEGYADGSGSGSTDYSGQYLTIEAEADTYMEFTKTYYNETRPVYYKINDGEWIYKEDWSGRVRLEAGDKLYLKGNNASYGAVSPVLGGCSIVSYDSNSRPYKMYGNIMSLIYGDDFADKYTFPTGSEANFVFMFTRDGDYSLISTENLVLPATALTTACYYGMFEDCRNLIAAPELPATTLAPRCYQMMFYGCSNLTGAPELPANVLTDRCYNSMFDSCYKLNYIKCLATTNININSSTFNWVGSVAANGTFIKATGINWPTGISGIPNGWSVGEE